MRELAALYDDDDGDSDDDASPEPLGSARPSGSSTPRGQRSTGGRGSAGQDGEGASATPSTAGGAGTVRKSTGAGGWPLANRELSCKSWTAPACHTLTSRQPHVDVLKSR